MKASVGFALRVEVAGGPSGSAWLFGPSACQTYCSAPKVTRVTGPEKCRGVLPFAVIYLLVLVLLTYVPAITLVPLSWMEARPH